MMVDKKKVDPQVANRMTSSKYGMLSIFIFAYDSTVETVLNLRRLSKRFQRLSQDSYIQDFFINTNYTGVHIELRSNHDFVLLSKAQRYSKIINAAKFLNLEMNYEYPKEVGATPESIRSDLRELIRIIASSPAYGILSIGTAAQFSLDLSFFQELFLALREAKV